MNTSPLTAMFWKESRENLRWAVLALLALSLGLAYAWYHLFQQPIHPSLGAIWGGENLVLTITTPLIGLASGLLQILPELRRDQWAFLVHRPASRTTLFWGKVLPGVCLYLGATILPLLGLAAWAAQPNHVPAPFDFRFTLAGWASILAGLPLYFAGLLVALRPARWYGSRGLPILTALLGPYAASQCPEFWQVVLACLAVTAVLLGAAWGSFVTGGEYKEQTKPARIALGLTLYPALAAVAIGALMLTSKVWNTAFPSKNRFAEWSYTDYQIGTAGQIYTVANHQDTLGQMHEEAVSLLSGQPISSASWQDLRLTHKVLEDDAFNYLSTDGLVFSSPYIYNSPDRYLPDMASTYSEDSETHWYYETAARQITCYAVSHKTPFIKGYLGPKGFFQDRKQAGSFEASQPGYDGLVGTGFRLLRFPHTLYWFRTENPAIGVIQAAPGRGGILGIATVGGSDGRDNPNLTLAVATEGMITVYGHDPNAPDIPRKMFTTPIAYRPDPGSTGVALRVARTHDGTRFLFWYLASPHQPNRIVTIASSGHVLRTQIFPAYKETYIPPKVRFADFATAVIFPPAALTASGIFGYIGDRLHWSSASGIWPSITASVGPILFFSGLGGLASAMLGWLISRRLGDGRQGQIVWAMGCFWLGGYGVLLLLALRAWPARLSCPNCGRARVVDRESCEHCGAAWARTKRDGTEIFDAGSGRETAAR